MDYVKEGMGKFIQLIEQWYGKFLQEFVMGMSQLFKTDFWWGILNFPNEILSLTRFQENVLGAALQPKNYITFLNNYKYSSQNKIR